MATVNFIPYRRQSATALGRVADYVAQEKKTVGRQLVSGINCSPQFSVQEFKAIRMVYRKDSPVWFYHYTQSFSPEEAITGQQAHEVAKKFAGKAWPDSQVLVATHVDAHHIHSHFIVNSVCFESGHMLRQGPRTLEKLRRLSDEICAEHGLSVLPPDPPKHSKEPGTREYRAMDKGQSWKMDLMLAIEDTMALARSREHFIKLMKRKGYKVRWTDERKSITYTTPGGMKCRDNRLHEDKFLEDAVSAEHSPYLFTDEHGAFIHPDTFTKHLRKIFRENGFPENFHLHTLRHLYVSTLLHHGVDKQTVADLAGHADTSFLERTYCHPQMELKNRAAQVMTDTLLHSA